MRLWYAVSLALLNLSGAHLGKSQSPENDKDRLTDEEASLCVDLHYPAVFKQCLLGGHPDYLRSVDECAKELDLVLPCQLDWITKDTSVDSNNCTAREGEEDLWKEADKKCLDGCIAKHLGLLSEEGTPDLDGCVSFVDGLPVFLDQPVSAEERTEMKSYLDKESSTEEFSENQQARTCFMGRQISLSLWSVVRDRALQTCVMRVCRENLSGAHESVTPFSSLWDAD